MQVFHEFGTFFTIFIKLENFRDFSPCSKNFAIFSLIFESNNPFYKCAFQCIFCEYTTFLGIFSTPPSLLGIGSMYMNNKQGKITDNLRAISMNEWGLNAGKSTRNGVEDIIFIVCILPFDLDAILWLK